MRKLKKRKIIALSLFFVGFLSFSLSAQTIVKGKIQDQNGVGISEAKIYTETDSVTYSNESGKYELSLPKGNHTLKVIIPDGEETSKKITIENEQSITLNFTVQGYQLKEVAVTGTRSKPRTVTDSPTPIDIIDIKKIAGDGAQVYINQILNYAAPSFTSIPQSLGNGTDLVDPASLRGLGPDQVLVLVNGKRRYNSSLLNTNGTLGKGSVGTDLNAIPVSSIERIEILRDAAAAQYGSDAIAGVINVILKNSVNKLSGSLTAGEYISKNDARNETTHDGESVQLGLNYGIPLGSNGGYINLSTSFDQRNFTNRAGEFNGAIYTDYSSGTGVDNTDQFLADTHTTRRDYSLVTGQSKLKSIQFAYNASLPLKSNTEIYSFGTFGYRDGIGIQMYRLPNAASNVIGLYPLGFLPQQQTIIYDHSAAIGIKGKVADWKVDLSNTFGQNIFNNKTIHSLNASLGINSPTSFKGGQLRFTQDVTNLDISREFDWLAGVNIAWGGEYRYENYQIIAGDENSWANYAMGKEVINPNGTISIVPDINGSIPIAFGPDGKTPLPGGAQGNNGFSPLNAVDAHRDALAGYVDVEINFTKDFLIDAAARYEYYNDFGSTINGKLAFRYKITKNLAFRGSGSTGFRAPSLQQRYFSSTNSLFSDGVMYQVGTFTNDSEVAKLLGIPSLKPEKSKSVSAGITAKVDHFSFTLDGYFTRINDRIVYTDSFSGDPNGSDADKEIYKLLQQANAQTARLFANAVDTETKGLDAVVSYNTNIGKGNLIIDLSGALSYTKRVGEVHTSQLLQGKENIYFSESSRIYLENVVPNQKLNLSVTYNINKWNFFVRNNYFGGVTEPTSNLDYQQFYNPRWVTDASIGYQFIKALKLTVGANNLFNVYPEKIEYPSNGYNGQFVYSRGTNQFGFNGRYLFTRLNFEF
ncbi:MAG: TonB-dependent receptor [Flavobacteriaceae bacterium]|jgi:iron complex outermembrane receptor protein|nr:TonB-dependent receptor [Flavobacteriaceae bacterium]